MNTATQPSTTRTLWITLSIATLLAVAAWFLRDPAALRSLIPANDRAATSKIVAAPEIATLPSVTADGYLVPARYALLSFAASNTVATVHVAEGDWVEAGAPLITLENRAQQAALAQAEANLAQAQAQLETVQAGARAEEIAQAEAAVEIANMNIYRLVDGATPEQIASTDMSIAIAQASAANVQSGATPQEITACYREFLDYEEGCRFQGCSHVHEPDCRVRDAVLEGKISQIRYDNYVTLYQESKNKRRY